MSEAAIALNALTAHTNNPHRQNIININSRTDTTLASQSQSRPPANCDSRSVPQIQIQGAAHAPRHVLVPGGATSRTPAQRQPEPRCGCSNCRTSQEHQGQPHVIAQGLKFLACWDCGPVGATIGIVGFVATTVLAYYALKLAIWTATKDYIEYCQADLVGLSISASRNRLPNLDAEHRSRVGGMPECSSPTATTTTFLRF